jgi:hypothetical protein
MEDGGENLSGTVEYFTPLAAFFNIFYLVTVCSQNNLSAIHRRGYIAGFG